MSLDRVYSYIESNQDRFIEDLRKIVRIPSISTQEGGTKKCAELLVELMREVGIEARVMETEWQPFVFGEVKSHIGKKTLLVTGHYDVVSPDPVKDWVYDPFAAEIHEGKIIGRGATDSKGNLMTHLKAVESFKTVGDLPLNLKFLFDGEEEIGSPSMPKFIDEHKELLKADAVLTFDGSFREVNAPTISFGNGGILYVEIEATGANKVNRSSYSGHLVPHPAWDLVWALSTVKSPDERVLIDGFYDNVKPPTEDQMRVLMEAPWDDEQQYKRLGIKRFVKDLKGIDALRTLLFEPKCTICGLSAGYPPGVQTILPNHAKAKIDFRLVPDQLPDDIFQKLKDNLLKHGIKNIKLTKLAATEPSYCSMPSNIGQATIKAAKEVWKEEPFVRPKSIGYGRQSSWIANRLGIEEGVGTGIGPRNARQHHPNEFMTIENFIKGIKYTTNIWHNYANI